MTEPRTSTYVLAYVALAMLATGTLLISRVPLGPWNLVVALALATAKAVLVLAVFMHLAHGRTIHRLVIAVAVAFVLLLLGGVLADVATRDTASSYVSNSGSP